MKKYSRYLIGLSLLLPACFLMFAYAKNAENIRLLYCVIEKLGMYDGYIHSTRNIIIWIILSVMIFVLVAVSLYFFSSKRELLMKYPFLKTLPYLILGINIGICFLSPRIDQLLLQFRNGLDGIIMSNRDGSLIGFLSYDSYGNITDPVFNFSWESSGPVNERFYVKLVDIEDETKQFVLTDENGIPLEMNMGQRLKWWNISKGRYNARSTSIFVEVQKIIPGYIDTPEGWRKLKYKVVIYNDKESKTFYFYYD